MTSDGLYIPTSWLSLIEDSLGLLYRNADRPLTVFFVSPVVGATNPTTCTLTDASSVNVGDILEMGQEMLIVTAKSLDTVPVLTVQRGWFGSPVTASGASAGDTVIVNPTFPRYRLASHLVKCLQGPMTVGIPEVVSYITVATTNQFYINLPVDCIKPVRLAYRVIYTSGGAYPFQAFQDVSSWHYDADLPTGVDSLGNTPFPTGKIINIPPSLAILGVNAPTSQVDLFITYERQYQWTPLIGGSTTSKPVLETDTVNLPVGGEDLPAMYAAYYEASGREMSRLQVDRLEQWQQEASVRTGVSIRMIESWRQQFMQRMEEAQKIKPQRTNRPYRKQRHFG